ncbi:MAG: class I SAM-dependent methyltransferase [Bacteroidetes bacterium]|nr:class I SAM-dependent methyltransferase [Bacteroidota bacterium]
MPPDCKEVVNVDSSLKMIEKARNLNVQFPVTFYHARIENTNLNGKFDVVITIFF